MMLMRLGFAITLILGTAACSTDESEAPPGSEAASAEQTTGTISVFDLDVGQCFNTPDDDVVEEVNAVECTEPHTYEVVASVDHPASSNEDFPGDDEILEFAEEECGAAWEGYVGISFEESELLAFAIHPVEETWRVGDREVLCAAYLEDEQLSESVQGSER
jgi:hypothetical protein